MDFRRGMGETSAVREEWQIRTRPQYGSVENKGTNQTDERTRENGQSSKTRELTDAQRGIADDSSSDRNANDTDKEPTKEEINKVTTLSNSDSAVQQVAKNEVRKWYGGIEKDRYDVSK